jgi:4a-hydroxytetrahydrobiopterin dehydratase
VIFPQPQWLYYRKERRWERREWEKKKEKKRKKKRRMLRLTRSLSVGVAPLSSPAIASALLGLPGWARCGMKIGTLTKTYKFKDYHQATAFMNSVSTEINELDHHPEWTNVYNTVTVRLTTHDAGNKITEKDIRLARAMEKAANSLK